MSRRTRSTTACLSSPPNASTPPGAAVTAWSPSGRRWCVLWKRSPTKTAAHIRGKAGHGWSSRRIRSLRSVSGLITGLHEPRATHLAMLESVSAVGNVNSRHLERAYAEARRCGYLWHEFGDSHLLLGSVAGRSHNDV